MSTFETYHHELHNYGHRKQNFFRLTFSSSEGPSPRVAKSARLGNHGDTYAKQCCFKAGEYR